jgi:hypothetical protein
MHPLALTRNAAVRTSVSMCGRRTLQFRLYVSMPLTPAIPPFPSPLPFLPSHRPCHSSLPIAQFDKPKLIELLSRRNHNSKEGVTHAKDLRTKTLRGAGGVTKRASNCRCVIYNEAIACCGNCTYPSNTLPHAARRRARRGRNFTYGIVDLRHTHFIGR